MEATVPKPQPRVKRILIELKIKIMIWCWKGTGSKSQAWVLSRALALHCCVTLCRVPNPMDTLLTFQTETPALPGIVLFWRSNEITNMKVLWKPKDLWKYKAVLFQDSRPLTNNRSIYLVKINISFFCVCWEFVCSFYSVERTSVTLPLKLAGDRLTAGGK